MSGTPRGRTQARTTGRSSATGTIRSRSADAVPATPTSPLSPSELPVASRLTRSLGVTRRAVAIIVVLAVLVLSYASSLRIYVDQQRDAARARAEIAASQARIDVLNDELERWEDPAYVTAQARQRLGWVMPGETGYVVIGPDGTPVEGGSRIDSARTDGERPDADAWWAKLAGGLEAADHPAPPPVENATVPAEDDETQPR